MGDQSLRKLLLEAIAGNGEDPAHVLCTYFRESDIPGVIEMARNCNASELPDGNFNWLTATSETHHYLLKKSPKGAPSEWQVVIEPKF